MKRFLVTLALLFAAALPSGALTMETARMKIVGGPGADGMVEDIITGLARIKWLLVTARNSSFVYKGKSVDVTQVGRELGVRYVLEGSVRKVSNRVRITGQLIEAETGGHVWADRYDRTLDDVFALLSLAGRPARRRCWATFADVQTDEGLEKDGTSLSQIHTYVTGVPNGTEKVHCHEAPDSSLACRAD